MTDADDRTDARDPVDPDHLDLVLDRLLAGTAAPEGPAWSGRVALLVHAAQSPAGADELAGEDDVVRRMRKVLAAPPDAGPALPARVGAPSPLGVVDLAERRARRADDGPYSPAHAAARTATRGHRLARGAGRVVAAKAAAATTAAVLGIAAAAATTGIVVTMVVPAVNDLARKPEPATVTTERRPQADGTAPGAGADRPVDRTDPAVICLSGESCDKGATAPDSTLTSTTLPPDTSTTTAPEATTSTSTSEATTTTLPSTTSDTSSTTVTDGSGSQGSGRGPGRPDGTGRGRPSDRS
jgi:hypothetical protein